MANAGCINAIGFDGCFLQTLQQLDSACIGVGVQFTAPNPLDDKRFDYIKYTDKCGNTCCLTGENEIMIYATQGVIKNLTLTNDDANEVVNVKRTDVFGSNWKKTVVRYKTGGYPTSITDGTLAVEELVQNQYQSSGYNVSGLTDGTTYYFSAFAVAQDDTIIVVQSKSIETSFGRKPGVNTLLYYSFNNQNLDDGSGNGRNGTRYNGAGTYTTGIKGYGVDMGGSHAIKIPMACPSGDFTYSICFKLNGYKDFQSFLGVEQRTSGCIHFHVAYGTGTNFTAVVFGGYTTEMRRNSLPSLNVRHNFILTRSGNVRTLYLDGTQVAQRTQAFSVSQSYQRYIGKEYTDDRYINGTIDEVIFENRTRTSTEISEYATKILS